MTKASYSFPQWLRDLYTKDLMERIKRHDDMEAFNRAAEVRRSVMGDDYKPEMVTVKVFKPGTVAVEEYGEVK